MGDKINTIFKALTAGGATTSCKDIRANTVTVTIEDAVSTFGRNLLGPGNSGNGGQGDKNPPPPSGGSMPPSGDDPNTLRWMFEFALTLYSPDALIRKDKTLIPIFALTLDSPDVLKSKNENLIPIPDGFIGPFPTREPGTEFRGSGHPIPKELKNNQDSKGFNIRVNSIRIMDANWNQPDRVVYENRLKQIVDPKTGQTSQDGGHFYLDK